MGKKYNKYLSLIIQHSVKSPRDRKVIPNLKPCSTKIEFGEDCELLVFCFSLVFFFFIRRTYSAVKSSSMLLPQLVDDVVGLICIE